MSYFSELYTEIKYPIATEHSVGLRNAQIGAIHAIASHSTLEPLDAAVIVMPTGSGKTTVLMLAPYLLQKSKVLIVTPSAMVRGQIVDDYKQLKTLKAIGVFCNDVTPPIVYEAEHLFSAEQINDISDADVVIASHQVAASISESEIKLLFDYVIIDEAHHVPAPTWQKIINNMKHAASLLVTATPFRLDKKEIQGTHIYNYPLSKAYRDGIFGSISFIPIDEAPDKDILIAMEAERVLLNDRADGYDHYLMVRTDTKEKAKGLEELYKAKTSLRLKRIDSSMSFGTVHRTIKSLRGKELDGIICVDMLGEGFDFPNLKIAAIHEPQKSLASTLQFIGRFARTNAENIGTAKFIAMNDEALRIENRKLYTSDAVWQDMIIEMSEEKINCDLENSEAIKQFSRPENGQDTISLHNIRPNCHARVYRVTDFNLEGVFPEELSVGENIYRSGDTNTIVGIATTNDTPLWLESNQPLNTAVNLYIVHYQTETGLLFIYSQQKTEVIYESIADSFCESHTKIPRNEMNRVLAGFSNYEFFNTGMQNRYAEAGESYRIYAGSNTAASIDETTGMMLSAGHAFCKVNQGGTDATIGYSSGSKFWSSSYLPIPEYVSWCDTFGKKIVNGKLEVKTNTNYDRLPIPTGISKYSNNIIFCFFPENAFLSPPSLRINGTDERIGLLTDADLNVISITPDGRGVVFDFIFGDVTERFVCNTMGEYASSTNQFLCRDGVHATTLAEYFTENPLLFKAADDTVYSGHEVLKGNITFEGFDQNRVVVFDWDEPNADITKEAEGAPKGKVTIQEAIKEHLLQGEQYSHIFFDHGPGEIADFLTFRPEGSFIKVELYHCKAMKGKQYNSSVEDVYEVAQQAVKSTVWIKSKTALLTKIQARIKGSSTSAFLRGDLKTLKALLQSQKAMETMIYIVQPAVSKETTMNEPFGKVLSAAAFYIRHTGRAKELKIIGTK